MGLCNRADVDEYNSDGDEVVMNVNDVMEITEVDDEYYVSNDFDVETEIVDGMEIVYGDEIEISATKHISLSSVAYDIPEFVGESEGTEDMTDKTPIEFFDKLVSPEITEEMVDKTNLYAQQHFEEHPEVSHRPCLNYWKKKIHTSTGKLQFFALVIIMETIHYPKLEDYRAQYWPISTVTFSCVMSWECFSLKFLHINDKKGQNEKGEPGYDPLHKIHPLITSLINTIQARYNPGGEFSIDEAIVSSKAEFGFFNTFLKNQTNGG